MKSRPTAIVLGGHFPGLGLIRSLAKQGVQIVLLDSEPCIAMLSRHVHQYIHSPDLTNESMFLDFLRYITKRQKLKNSVIFPTEDKGVYFLSRNKEKLTDILRVTTPDWQVSEYAYNKIKSYQLAEKIGIPIPVTCYPRSRNELSVRSLTFPVVIKPAIMWKFYKTTGKKVFYASTKEELLEQYDNACSIIDPDEIIIQEVIPDIADQLYSFCPFFKNSRVMAHIILRRFRHHPMEFGHCSTYAETADCPEIEPLGRQLLSKINYYGICEIEFVKDPRDGIFKFLEINPRTWGQISLAQSVGINLPYLVYADMIEQKIQVNSSQIQGKWVHLLTDMAIGIQQIVKGNITAKDYFDSIKNINSFAVYDKSDFLPMLSELIMVPYLWKKRGF